MSAPANPIAKQIARDVERFKRDLNKPEPPKVYGYGDGSGACGFVVLRTNEVEKRLTEGEAKYGFG